MTWIHDFVCDLAKADKSVKEVRDIIKSAYPGQGLSLSQVYRLIKDVKDGKDTTDMRGRNKPKTTMTPEVIESVKADMVPRGTTVNANYIVGAFKQF